MLLVLPFVILLKGAPCTGEGATYTTKTDIIAMPSTGDQATYNKARKQA
jgi:hypothetical protein